MPKFDIDTNDKKEIGKTGEYVSAIGLGSYGIRDYKTALESYVYAIENGISLIDTAQIYGTEDFVGSVIKRVGKERVFVDTKIWPNRLTSKDEVLKAAKESLQRLGLSTVDLFLIHWPNRDISIEEQVRNFEEIYLQGLARYIGVSNFTVSDLEKAIHATRKAELVVDQVRYSVSDKKIESDLLKYCIDHNITIQAYTPIEHGRVVNNEVIDQIAKKYDKTPIQVALNYLISRPRVIPIPKAEKLDHIKEILGAMGWRLKAKDIEELEKI